MTTITVKGDAKAATQELKRFRDMLHGAERQMPGSIRNLKSEILIDPKCENSDECSSSEQITLRRVHHRNASSSCNPKTSSNLQELLAKCLSRDSDDDDDDDSESEDNGYSSTDESDSDLESESDSESDLESESESESEAESESESESESTESESESNESESDSDSNSDIADPCARLNKLLGLDSCSDSDSDSESEPDNSLLEIGTDSESESESNDDQLFNLRPESESDIDPMFGVDQESSLSSLSCCSEKEVDSDSCSLDSDSCSFDGSDLKHLSHGGEDEIEIVIHRYHRYH